MSKDKHLPDPFDLCTLCLLRFYNTHYFNTQNSIQPNEVVIYENAH